MLHLYIYYAAQGIVAAPGALVHGIADASALAAGEEGVYEAFNC